ncbi:MAG: hypothetical protein UU82_C0002G0021 [Candidatus Nomurabacteria bacterium GW2011_GWC2_41_8]|uniref:HD domain-containing protein n=2 Tax=Candidatus Nomuraibacteriota TaxID=1752729 RepID=A0A0G0ZRP9_9BACT|nr:MAG: hypothetical protein UU58_C0002G0025 [Candidatus Nomurabacteria bacterium GW2011_GWA2_41_25]KKS24656.1 MAG: hypothetical protein UU82_C0002G0021 [Candidatus Nomurabacteria bacterium GW2011_GWC2_41_8]
MAYSEIEKTGIPARMQADFSMETGKRLAKELGANVDIVEVGTLLMDCMLGQAVKENRQSEHVKISLEKTNELLSQSSLSEEEKENIRHCISEHHGVSKFYSLESEICCNADCYKFTSIKGFAITLRYTRDMPFLNLIKLLNDKVEEKWNALSLGVVKKELTPEHQTLINMLKGLSEEK